MFKHLICRVDYVKFDPNKKNSAKNIMQIKGQYFGQHFLLGIQRGPA